MKTIWLALLLVSSCGWRQRDFEKDLDKPTDTTPQVEVKDKELLEKFEAQPLEDVSDTPPETPAPRPATQAGDQTTAPVKSTRPKPASPKPTPTRKKSSPSKVVTKTKAVNKPEKKLVVTTVRKVEKSLPADYPPELLKINEKAQKVWNLYGPNHHVGEKIYLNIKYMGMTVGKIMATNKGKKIMNDREVWHFHARFKSAPFYSNIYELDDTVDTYVAADQFLSMRYSLIQRESKQNVDDLQLFDRDQMKLFWFYKRKKSGDDAKKKEGERFIPYFSMDPFSLLFFYQGLPLKNGDVYEIPIVNKDKVMIMKSVVQGREKLQTDLGKRHAIRVHATTQYSGETLKSGDLTFWFSDDEQRTLLRASAKIKIGSVNAEIVKP